MTETVYLGRIFFVVVGAMKKEQQKNNPSLGKILVLYEYF